MKNTEWQSSAQSYLEQLGRAEYASAKKKAKGRKFRFSPSDYMRSLVDALGRNDEEGFKAIKGEEGYSSAYGC